MSECGDLLDAYLKSRITEALKVPSPTEAESNNTSQGQGTESTRTSEKDGGVKWTTIINTKGGHMIFGKLMKDWLDYSVPPSLPVQHMNDFQVYNKTGVINGYYAPQFLGLLYQSDATERFRDSNYLIASAPIDTNSPAGKALSPDGSQQYRIFSYGTWAHLQYTPDSRGQNPPFQFIFSLPATEADNFLNEVEQNPDLVEEIYKTIYPKLGE